ncbi:DUF5317 family protein [Effusibacillus pohliae]|uniref:DUF5317 family protein n=1 Tax=Effusibacillus pohliae TaxID=232270 RepID=UPI0003753FA0|nr:DUF5317 family protein [Effusibacillus pohliae]
MIYFVIAGIGLALLFKRNPVSIVFNIRFKVPYVMIGCFLIQLVLAILAVQTNSQHPVLLGITFLGMLVSLFLNRHLYGVKWIFSGTLLNVLSLLLHGGLMPVSETAMRLAGFEDMGFDSDSRHQLMKTSPFWWLGDWIPFITPLGRNYVLSIGDLVIGIGLILFIIKNSRRKGWDE